MSESLGVDPRVLVDAAAGINSIVGALSELGIGETAAVGRGFANIALSTSEAGHHGVQQSVEDFAERWSWGVRALVKAANSIAEALDLSAGLYHSIEQANSKTLKVAWTNTFGNPRLGAEEIETRSWGEVLAENPANTVRNPDYSAQSFGDAWNTIVANAATIGNDAVDIVISGSN